jgi:hypothetical protein
MTSRFAPCVLVSLGCLLSGCAAPRADDIETKAEDRGESEAAPADPESDAASKVTASEVASESGSLDAATTASPTSVETAPLPTPASPEPLEREPLPPPEYEPWVDEREPRPPWQPAFTLDEQGWRDSAEPICSPLSERNSTKLWADERGVYAQLSAYCANHDSATCPGIGQALEFNDGSGWRQLLIASQRGTPLWGLIGVFSNGQAVFSSNELGIAFVDPALGLTQALPFVDSDGPARVAIQALGEDVVYLVVHPTTEDISPPSTLYAVTADEVTKLGSVTDDVSAIWADSKRAVFAGAKQFVMEYSVDTREFSLVPAVPVGDYLAAWGFGDDGLWLGNTVGQLVLFDGSAWQVIDTGTQDRIEELWGTGDTVFFRTGTAFGRATAAGAEIIVPSSANLTVDSIAGIATDEVFVAFEDRTFEQYACGGAFITWFDGAVFHLM